MSSINYLPFCFQFREISYNVQLASLPAYDDCKYSIKQVLPADVYVSVDELDHLQRLGKV